MKFRFFAVFLLPLALIATPAFAQNRVILTGTRNIGQAPSAACVQEGQVFINIAAQYPTPRGWTFDIVCTEHAWRQFLRKSGQLKHGVLVSGVVYKNNPRVQVYGTTYLASHITYIRGYKLTHPDPWMSPAHIVVHEIAHIVLQSTNEKKVDHQALEWIAEHKQTGRPIAVGASSLAQTTSARK